MEVNLDTVESESKKTIKITTEKKNDLIKVAQKCMDDITKIRIK